MYEYWLDMRKEIPGLRGQILHTVWRTDVVALIRRLENIDFKVYILEGSKIINEATFFAEVARIFEFPSYFGHNWDAWDECLGDFGHLAPQRVGIIWIHADQSFAEDACTFLQAVFDIYNMARSEQIYATRHPEQGKKPKQIEILLLGESQGFRNTIDLVKP